MFLYHEYSFPTHKNKMATLINQMIRGEVHKSDDQRGNIHKSDDQRGKFISQMIREATFINQMIREGSS